MGEETGADVAEISAGHADHRGMGFIGPLLPGEEVIELLGKPAGHIDGIGGGEEKSRSLKNVGSAEGLFDHVLAVVEGAVDFESGDVARKGGELEFLDAADLAGGI